MRTLLMIPTREGTGLGTVVSGMARALSLQGVRVCTFCPVFSEDKPQSQLPSLEEVPNFLGINLETVQKLFSQGKIDEIVADILAKTKALEKDFDVIVMQGVKRDQARIYATRLNAAIFRTLNAQVILVTTPDDEDQEFNMQEQIAITARPFGGVDPDRVLGCIINKITMPGLSESDATRKNKRKHEKLIKTLAKQTPHPIIASIPCHEILSEQRNIDIARKLEASCWEGNASQPVKRVKSILVCNNQLETLIDQLQSNIFAIVDGDRQDILLAICLNAIAKNHRPQLSGLMIAGNHKVHETTSHFLKLANEAGLAIFNCSQASHEVYLTLNRMEQDIPFDDHERIHAISDFIAETIDTDWLKQWISSETELFLTPVSFKYQLIEKARLDQKTIVLPEGTEPRTIMAANQCAEKGIAKIVLLGNQEKIKAQAENLGVSLHDSVTLINPKDVYENYLKPLLALRKHKGLNEPIAREQLQDPIVLGTMMLKQGDVDGLVSGAEHTTAHTIRPALQLIKTADNRQLVSSIFFMCLPDQVLIYGDCAVNPTPNAEELADIAISSVESAIQFGISPKVAMISYSTGTSGQGSEVELVKKATEIVKATRPDIIIDGPLQYDAALIPSVAAKKAPNSPVAGHANVIIFPDLNTGNTTYKAVQRSANTLSMGPMLQGLAKPVNDLSRGATVEDIIYTIALTAIQAQQ